MIKVYLAAPLFNQAELRYNEYLGNLLRDVGFTVFLPQECEDKPSADSVSLVDLTNIYLQDIRAVESCDCVVAVCDGADMDSGTAFEVGYAVAKGKPVYVLRTDIRMQNNCELVNLMVQVGSTGIFTSISTLVAGLRDVYGNFI